MERDDIPASELAQVLEPGALAFVAELHAAFDIRILSDDPWFRLLPPLRMPPRIRELLLAVVSACHGAADRDELLVRTRAAAAAEWDVSVRDDDPDDPRSWVLVELRLAPFPANDG